MGGSAKPQSFIELQAAVEEARQRQAEADARVAELRNAIEAGRAEQARAKELVAQTGAARKEAEGHRNAVLLERIEQPERKFEDEYLRPRLVVRQSTAAPRNKVA